MKKLFLHIGLSKTGSSAVQSWLSLNSVLLRKCGYNYADLAPDAKLEKITSGNGALLKNKLSELNKDELVILLSKTYFCGSDIAIISSESLQAATISDLEKLKAALQALQVDTKIIAFMRSVYELCYSNYQDH